jgi:hypothetical protein
MVRPPRVTYNQDDKVEYITSTLQHGTCSQPSSRLEFAYDGNGQVATVTREADVSNNWANVSRASYSYYGIADAYGNPEGELQSVLCQTWDAAIQTPAFVGTDTYNYSYDSTSGNLFLAFTPQDTINARHSLNDVSSLDGIDYWTYASDAYFSNVETIGDNGYRITTVVQHGIDVNSFWYGDYSSSDYNFAKRETVETFWNSDIQTTYTNFLGELLATDYLNYMNANPGEWYTYNQYDGGRLTLSAATSAVTCVSVDPLTGKVFPYLAAR